MTDIVLNQQSVCFFCPLGQRTRAAVVWIDDDSGRGACGHHERQLTDLAVDRRQVAV